MTVSGLWQFLCILAPLLINATSDDSRADTDTLQLVTVLYRHGDRAPIKLYPNDPNTADVWPQGLGQLTQLGIQQGYDLGTFLRTRYDGFLDQTYHFEELYVMSTDVDRCLMTAQAVLAGLYPPEGVHGGNEDLPWQPVPIHTTPKRSDQLLGKASCPMLAKLRRDVFDEPVVYNYVRDNYKDLFESIHKLAGYNWTFPKSGNIFSEMKDLIDTIYIEAEGNQDSDYIVTLPDWLNDTLLTQLKTEVYPWIDYVSFYTNEMVRLSGGQLIHQIITDMRLKQAGILSQKMTMYSAHDATVLSLLAAVHSYENVSVEYTGVLMVELHEIEVTENITDYVVRIYYKNGPGAPVRLLELPGCLTECSYDAFLKMTKDTQLQDRYRACMIEYSKNDSLALALVAYLSIFLIFFLLLCVGCGLYWRMRRKTRLKRRYPYQRDTLDLGDSNEGLHHDDSDGSVQLEPLSILPPNEEMEHTSNV